MSEGSVQSVIRLEDLLKERWFIRPLDIFIECMRGGSGVPQLAEKLETAWSVFHENTDDLIPGHEENRYMSTDISCVIDGQACPIRVQHKNGELRCAITIRNLRNIYGSRFKLENTAEVYNESVMSIDNILGSLLNLEEIFVDEAATKKFTEMLNDACTVTVGTNKDGAHDFSLKINRTVKLDSAAPGSPYSFDNVAIMSITSDVEITGIIDTINGDRGTGWEIIYKMTIKPIPVESFLRSTSLTVDGVSDHFKNNNNDYSSIPEGNDLEYIVIGNHGGPCVIAKRVMDKPADDIAVKQLTFDRVGKIIQGSETYGALDPVINLLRYKGLSAVQLGDLCHHLKEHYDVALAISAHGVTLSYKKRMVLISKDTEDRDVVYYSLVF